MFITYFALYFFCFVAFLGAAHLYDKMGKTKYFVINIVTSFSYLLGCFLLLALQTTSFVNYFSAIFIVLFSIYAYLDYKNNKFTCSIIWTVIAACYAVALHFMFLPLILAM